MHPWIDFRPVRRVAAALLAALALCACQSLPNGPTPLLGARLDASIGVMAAPHIAPRELARADGAYRDLVVANLPRLLEDAARPGLVPKGRDLPGVYRPEDFDALVPVRRSRVGEPGLHRAGLGLPLVGHLPPTDPNAPLAGYRVPLTLVALPRESPSRCCDAALVDPRRVGTVHSAHGDFAVAMDLEAPLDATRVTGPRLGAGLMNLLRADRFAGRSRIVFLQPFDPDKIPLVLVHGLMSTPRMWSPLVKALLADPAIRDRFQIWFFYYPTGQPVPISALQLREALDAAVGRHRLRKPMILVGHSMGGILSRAQVSRLTAEDARAISPEIASLPKESVLRRSLVFEPRADVSRVVFMFTPHRGSRFAVNRIGTWGIALIRLPEWLIGELSAYGSLIPDAPPDRLPTSIHGLSPESQFLQILDRTGPVVPVHTIVGDRGRGDLKNSSDGVVSYASSHLPFAESEIAVPTWHSGIAHPGAIAELRRILHRALEEDSRSARKRTASRP